VAAYFIACAGLFFVVLGVWFLVLFAQEPPDTQGLAVGYALAVLGFVTPGLGFGWLSLSLLRHLALRVTAEGIIDDVIPFARVGLIPWEEVIEVRAHKFFVARTLAIWLRDPDRVLGRKPPLVRFLIGNMGSSGRLLDQEAAPPTLQLDWSLVAGDVDRLVDEINATFPDVIAAHSIVVHRDPIRGIWPFYRRVP
jgi:hypothetical protein